MTAPAGPAGVGPAPAADQVIKPAPTAPEKVPVQVLADINLEKHLQQVSCPGSLLAALHFKFCRSARVRVQVYITA